MTASEAENVGDRVAEAVIAVIQADSPASPYSAFGVRPAVQLPASRVDVRSVNWIRASDQMDKDGAGAYYYNHRRGVVSLTVVSQRHTQEKQGADSKHGIAIGRCRWLMSRAAQKLVPPNGGGYEILDIVDQGDSWTFDTETSTDRTEVRFQIDLVIPPANYTT